MLFHYINYGICSNVLGRDHRVFVPTSHHLEYGVNTLDCSLTAFKLMGVYIRTGPSPLEPHPPNSSFLFLSLSTSKTTDECDNEGRQTFLRLYHRDRGTDHENLYGNAETLVNGKSATLAPTRSQRERRAVWRSRARHVHKYLSVKSPFP